MRRTAAAALLAALAVATPAAAAPRGVTFTDPVGDADALDGRTGAASQAAFDVTKVRIAPHARTARSSGIAVRVDLAAAPATSPGSSYVFTARQGNCDITVSRTVTADGPRSGTLVMCEAVVGFVRSAGLATSTTSGRSVTFTVPADSLPDATPGAQLTGIEISTAGGEPALGFATPARIDRAAYPKAYRIGS